MGKMIARSSNGRTAAFGAVYLGSNPSLAAMYHMVHPKYATITIMPHKIILAALGAVLALGGSYGGYTVFKDSKNYGANFETRPHTVRSVLDGDTVRIEKWIKVRLLGINAPERGECYFAESKEFLSQLIDDKAVQLEKDRSGTDKLGRLLRHIILKSPNPEEADMHVNNEMILQGYAFRNTLSPDIAYRDLFAASELKAKKAKRGMWGACDYLEKEKATQKLRQQDTKPSNPECTIKGNVSEKGFGRIYSFQGCSNWSRVKIDPARGDKYFCTEQEAVAAGFTRPKTCPR